MKGISDSKPPRSRISQIPEVMNRRPLIDGGEQQRVAKANRRRRRSGGSAKNAIGSLFSYLSHMRGKSPFRHQLMVDQLDAPGFEAVRRLLEIQGTRCSSMHTACRWLPLQYKNVPYLPK
jgi:hypothetical protein